VTSSVEIKQLVFGYGERRVLDDINLIIEAGEYLALIGPNGVGKSTLLKCINRILKFQTGQIHVFGQDLKKYSQKDLGAVIGYVPQYHEQSFAFSVFEFVLMARYPRLDGFRPPNKEDERKVEEALALVGLSDFRERKVNRISGGERQKVYIAAALAQEPKILLLDEPTAHLDPRYHSEIQKLICKVSRDLGLTVIHVTHDLNHIFSWSHRVVALKEGKVFMEGTPQEVLTPDNLRAIFQTEFIFVSHPKTNQPIIVSEL
jgi:iron complex transport system ATP-binding protein